jgi:hypothetical protein
LVGQSRNSDFLFGKSRPFKENTAFKRKSLHFLLKTPFSFNSLSAFGPLAKN